jgi:gluconolactonase
MKLQAREITNGLRFPEGPIAMPDGSVLVVEIEGGRLTRCTMDGQREIVAELGGGPNGAALGPNNTVYICNNGGFNWVTEDDGYLRPHGKADTYHNAGIQRVDLASGAVEMLYTHCRHPGR